MEFVRSYKDSGMIVANELVNSFKTDNENFKEMSLYLFAEMRNEIVAEIPQENIVSAFISIIVPLLSSESPMLKSRACMVAASYLEDITFDSDTIFAIAGKLYECFSCEELQIKMPAATALAIIIEKYDEISASMEPSIPNILQGYLVISDRIDSEEVVFSLQKIINKLSGKLEPFAFDLLKALSQLFFKHI